MKLAIFDIDGTLTATSKADADCYVQVFKDQFNLEIANGDWDRFKHYTDSGIMAEIFDEEYGREPTAQEHQLTIAAFERLLRDAFDRNPTLFAAVAGASKMLDHLRKANGWAIAMATGCWRASAEFKLSMANINWRDIPIATSDDEYVRVKIMEQAQSMALSRYQVSRFERIVYIGDGIWDLISSRELGFGFIGMQHEGHHKSLSEAGAKVTIPDYRDLDGFMALLETAPTP